ncbi:MAG: MoxR family ATPase [Clostridia bacterium]|nr:MoxR family ATPase [Clostridia bacterium]
MEKINLLYEKVRNNVSKAVVGKDNVIRFLFAALLCGGHALICDVPGTGKTLITKSLASSLGLSFRRIQFTPDLLPSDITGIKYFNMKTSEFEFIAGPVFANVVLADEINRATPKTQAGLLECMAEYQVTTEGETHPLDLPFMVIATQNPVESAGVYELPEAQLDRFLVNLRMNLPTHTESVGILKRYDKKSEAPRLEAVTNAEEIKEAQAELDSVYAAEDIYSYIVNICESTHGADGVELGVSPRGALALLSVSKCLAAMNRRDYVLPDDVKEAAVVTLAHRLLLTASAALKKNAAEEIIKDIIDKMPVPTENLQNYRLK